MNAETFGDHLIEARNNAGMTREGLAEALGRSADTIAGWERGRNKPRPSTLIRLANVLGITAADLSQ